MSKPFKPRGAFQTAASLFLLDTPRCALHVDMGLGKTTMTLNAIDALFMIEGPSTFLIIAPLRVARTTWKEETQKWDHLKYLKISPIVGDAKQRVAGMKANAHGYTVNYENLPWLLEQWGDKWPYTLVIADESTKLKSNRAYFRKTKSGKLSLVRTGGKRTIALATVAFTKIKRMWLLTGTPAPNSLADLYGQTWFIDGGKRLGNSFTNFDERWFKLDFNGFSRKMLPHAEKEIHDAIADVTFTLRAEDYLELGDEITNTIWVEMPPKARAIYDEMEKDMFIQIEAGDVEVFSAASKSAKCHQLANGAVYYDAEGRWEEVHDAKIQALQSVIEEASGMPVIVVYKFKSDLMRLKAAFPTGVAMKDNSAEADFKAGKIPILFLHPDSAGHGVDGLQNVTNIMVFFSVDWNYETRAQTIARIGKVRQYQAGFTRPAFIHQICCKDTVDTIVLDRLETKCSVEEALKRGLARKIK